MEFNPLPDDLLQKMIDGIESFKRDNNCLDHNAKSLMLQAALARPSFYPPDILEQINQRRGSEPLLPYLRSHEPFELAFGAYLGI